MSTPPEGTPDYLLRELLEDLRDVMYHEPAFGPDLVRLMQREAIRYWIELRNGRRAGRVVGGA